LYELLEWWWVLLFYPNNGPEWLGIQGDPWDAQGDMFAALCGGLTAILVFARLHDRSMVRVD
jgi:putative membrane protein